MGGSSPWFGHSPTMSSLIEIGQHDARIRESVNFRKRICPPRQFRRFAATKRNALDRQNRPCSSLKSLADFWRFVALPAPGPWSHRNRNSGSDDVRHGSDQSRIAGADRCVWWLAVSRRRFGTNANLAGEGKQRYCCVASGESFVAVGFKRIWERPPVGTGGLFAFFKVLIGRFRLAT